MDILTVETLKLEEEDDNDNQTATISFPIEIIQEILSRLPVKPILRFRSVSKQWLSLISSDPCFHKLHFNRSVATTNDRTSFFISAYDTSTKERHFLSAPHDGGPVTHLITLPDNHYDDTEAEHLNGLVFFTSGNIPFDGISAFVVNPATRKVFKVPPSSNNEYPTYFFGFDESKNEHKILSTSSTHNPKTMGFMIFSLSTYSWRQVPVDLEDLSPGVDIIPLIKHSVCVNSVIHLMLDEIYQSLAFHLTTEKFSIINLPQGAILIPREVTTPFTRLTTPTWKGHTPFLIKDKELLGVVCHDFVVRTKEIHIWILQDYVNRVWVRETVMGPEFLIKLKRLGRIDYRDIKNLVYSCRRSSRDMVNAFILDIKTKSFKSVNFDLGYPFLHLRRVRFQQVRSYVESILPLREE